MAVEKIQSNESVRLLRFLNTLPPCVVVVYTYVVFFPQVSQVLETGPVTRYVDITFLKKKITNCPIFNLEMIVLFHEANIY